MEEAALSSWGTILIDIIDSFMLASIIENNVAFSTCIALSLYDSTCVEMWVI